MRRAAPLILVWCCAFSQDPSSVGVYNEYAALPGFTTHALARTQDEAAIQDALRRGRSFAALDSLANSKGFRVFAVNSLGVYELGDTVPLAQATRLVVKLPVKAQVRVISQGRVIAQRTGETVSVPLTDPGAYRVEAWLESGGATRLWIFTGHLYAEALDPASLVRPPRDLAANVEAELDLPYTAEPADPSKQKLDIYRPKDASNRPVLFFIHGGAWRSGDRSQYPAFANRFARQGFVVVVPGYRLSPKFAFPAHIEDVASAFAWTVQHIAEHGGDPRRILLAGHSAGGHLAALLALDPSYLAKHGVSTTSIRAVAALSGVYQIGAGASAAAPGVFPGSAEEWKRASPITYVRKDAPRFVITYCQWDYLTLPQQAVQFQAALLNVGASTELRYVESENHLSEVMFVPNPDNAVGRLLEELLKDLERR